MSGPYAEGVTIDWTAHDAVLFDLDGVLTPTADVHLRAWTAMFDDYLAGEPGQSPFTEADYHAHVDGKPRFEGVATFLASRGIEPADDLVQRLGEAKNHVFVRVLETEGVDAYPGSVAFLDELARRGTAVAVVSSSRNARAVLTAAGLIDRFEVIVDGAVATERGIAGKPQPDTFLDAADQLGVPRERAIVVEDAVSGVQAGRAGDFGLVIGVDRGAGADVLAREGADLVVADLAELLEDAA